MSENKISFWCILPYLALLLCLMVIVIFLGVLVDQEKIIEAYENSFEYNNKHDYQYYSFTNEKNTTWFCTQKDSEANILMKRFSDGCMDILEKREKICAAEIMLGEYDDFIRYRIQDIGKEAPDE